jgi:thiol:disulfide interchange protein DsbD
MVGLSLSGVFHLPVLMGNVGGDLANESSTRGSFFTGVLATAVATPCTAPFMASAVGAALTMPAFQAMMVFEALGFGLALPFLLISLFPALRKFLPKPGAWMDTFKQLIAFPMYASVIWLMWVLTLQTGAGGMVVALCGMLLIVIVIWMKSLFADGSKAYTITALIIYALLLTASLSSLSNMEVSTAALPSGHAEHGVEAVEYSKEKLDELIKAGKPVFVDATAAWCITCQVNARTSLHTSATMKIFKEKGVTLMIADWTKRNDSITDYLSSFGYKGVPLCVFYPASGKKPLVMPQILTETLVINTIKGE